MKVDDIYAVTQLNVAAFRGHAGKELPFQKQLRNVQADWKCALKSACFLAIDKKKVIGYVMAGLKPFAWEFEKTGCIFNIGLLENYRRKGIATALLRKSEGALKKAGVRRVMLKVRNKNKPAINFYKKLGYKTIAFEMARIIK